MADDTQLNPGTGGDLISTDDIGLGVKVQRVKVQYGVDGSATDVSDTNPLPIDDAGGSLTVDNGGAFPVQEDGAALTALQLIDNIVHTEDAAHQSGDAGVPALAVRRDTAASGASLDGDYATVNVDASGRVWAHDPVAEALLTTINTDTSGMATSLAVIDDWDESDRAKVNTIVGQAGVQGGSGIVGANTQRVVLATDVGLPAGSNNIGDVDIATLPAPLSTTGGGTEAAALRVTIATDSTGTLSVDDGGGALTVDGTVTAAGGAAHDAAVAGNPNLIGCYASAAAPTNVSASGDAVRAWALLNGAQCTQITAAGALVGGDATNGLDVDVTRVPAPLSTTGGGTEATALRVTVASDSTGVLSVDDNGGSLTVDGAVTASGAAAHDAAVSGNPLLNGLEARTSDGTAVGNGDAVRASGDTLGKQVVLLGSVHDLTVRDTANFTTTTAADVIAAIASARIVVTGILVTNAHATVGTKVTIRDGTNTELTGYAAAAGGGFAIASSTPIFIGTANTAVTAICGTTGADVDVTVWGYRIAN